MRRFAARIAYPAFHQLLASCLLLIVSISVNAGIPYYCQNDADGDTVGYGSIVCRLDTVCVAGETSVLGQPGTQCGSTLGGDEHDNCPYKSNTSQTDGNADGIGDACQGDKDSDGVLDVNDNCPLLPNASQTDTDLDGVGNACDTTPNGDSDGDGKDNVTDNCPLVSNASQSDLDIDGIGDICDTDQDGDGIDNASDNCSVAANANQLNTDADAQGNVCDNDDDNDGVVDVNDGYPLDPLQAGDLDGDGVDGFVDNCPSNINADQLNTDGDTQGNTCDTDDDNDGVIDVSDKFSLNAAASSDTDNDGFPGSWNAACDLVCQSNSGLVLDNCSSATNVDQLNTDGDAQGNACDSDDDNDGIADASDAYPINPLYSADVDRDTLPDNWESARGRNPTKADYAVSTNASHACAIDDVGVKCWGGTNASGQLNVPATLQHPYAVTTGNSWSCACDDNGSQCWGSGYPATPSCVVSTAGASATLLFDGPGGCGSQAQTYPPGYYVSSVCSINSAGDVACDTSGTNKTYPLISVVNFYTCNWTTYNITGQDKLFTLGSIRQLSQSDKRLCMLGNKGIQCAALAATTARYPDTTVSVTDFTLLSLYIDSDGDGVPRPIDSDDLDISVTGDMDNDGIDSIVDLDDDGDGVLDYIDAAPFNAANTSEVTLPLSSGYKGSAIAEQVAPQ